MKKVVIALVAVLLCVFLFKGCQSDEAPPETPATTGEYTINRATPMEEILVLFEQYAQSESEENAVDIALRFAAYPAIVLEALAVTQYREQALNAISSTIATARQDGPELNAYLYIYNIALAIVGELALDEEPTRMLAFIKANIEYWNSQ